MPVYVWILACFGIVSFIFNIYAQAKALTQLLYSGEATLDKVGGAVVHGCEECCHEYKMSINNKQQKISPVLSFLCYFILCPTKLPTDTAYLHTDQAQVRVLKIPSNL